MGIKAKNTEHSGAKNGGTGYFGKRAQAKAESNKKRREINKKIIRASKHED